MPLEAAKLLRDMLDAASTISGYTSGKTEASYIADRPLREAVQWNFAVIGEALSQLRQLDPSIAEQISEWRRIIGFRNQLIHGYGTVRHAITWSVIERKLPVLHRELAALLGEL